MVMYGFYRILLILSYAGDYALMLKLTCVVRCFVFHECNIVCFWTHGAHFICLLLDLPIFSVDIHPDGSRFATGGQGEVIISSNRTEFLFCFSLSFCVNNKWHTRNYLITKFSGLWNITYDYLSVKGEDSGRIVVWNMAPVVSEKVENDENVPKMLCQMDNHLGE